MRTVIFDRDYPEEGLDGILLVPDDVDIEAEYKVFIATYFTNNYPRMSDKWINRRIAQIKKFTEDEYVGLDSLGVAFVNWLVKNKNCEVLDVEYKNIRQMKEG